MPKSKDDATSPKNKKIKKNKSRQLKKNQDSDSDSSSDYDPVKDELYEDESINNALDIQKFMQKMFPSKSGKDRLKQLEKLDKLIKKTEERDSKKKTKKKCKKIKNKVKKPKTEEEEIVESEEATEEDDVDYGEEEPDFIFDAEEDEEYIPEDEDVPNELMDMLGNNMKFNIIFTVGNPNDDIIMGNRPSGYLEGEDEYDEDYNPEDDDGEDNDDDDEEEEDEEDEEEEDDANFLLLEGSVFRLRLGISE